MSKRNITHIEKKIPLHGKRVYNHSLIVLKLIATCVLSEMNSTNEE